MNAPHPISAFAEGEGYNPFRVDQGQLKQSRKKSKYKAAPSATAMASPVFDKEPEYSPTFSLSRQVAAARREMGAARWAQLNSEWEA